MEVEWTEKGVCVDGFKAAGVRDGKYGLALIAADRLCAAAGVFTKNSAVASPVLWSKKAVKGGLSAVVANSGCANACVKDGFNEVRETADAAGRALGVQPARIGVASTGIIGRRLDIKIVERLIDEASRKLSTGAGASMDAARAIMTTDTKLKQVSVSFKGVEVGGICKGAGMIAPEMATMLCFITTNAELSSRELQAALDEAVQKSFNMTVIDGDMSTNDTVLLLSSGRKKCRIRDFKTLLGIVTTELAKMIAKDGEGASKYIEITVTGAKDRTSASTAAKAVASSPLVKTAFYGVNPNWGRIMSAIGSKLRINPMKATISFTSRKGKVAVFDRGRIGDLDKAREVLKEKDISVTVNLRMGTGEATAFTCDLTEEYVRINAGYN